MPFKPIVLVPACNRMIGEHPFQVAGQKYLDAVRLAGCTPLVIPNAGLDELDALLALADGVLLTGSKSNVHPSHFGQDVHDPSLPLDPQRDALTLALVPRALAMGLPLLAICRGAQEANVALGGSLYQAVQEAGPYQDHRAPEDEPAEVQYEQGHPVTVVAGGCLQAIVGMDEFEVNSLHGQAVRELAPGLRVEALAPDGLVEAFSVPDAAGFNLCVQWHPEWKAASNAISVKLMLAFGQACRDWRAQRQQMAGAAATPLVDPGADPACAPAMAQAETHTA